MASYIWSHSRSMVPYGPIFRREDLYMYQSLPGRPAGLTIFKRSSCAALSNLRRANLRCANFTLKVSRAGGVLDDAELLLMALCSLRSAQCALLNALNMPRASFLRHGLCDLPRAASLCHGLRFYATGCVFM